MCRYLVSASETQATFTGKQQRAGVYILPFAVHGLFGLGAPRPPRREDAPTARGRGGRGRGVGRRRATTRSRPRRSLAPIEQAPTGNADSPDADAPFLLLPDDDDVELPKNFKFDWSAYHASFGDTPMQDAVTAMFSEYAVLYGRIAGWVTSTKPAPMTVGEGEDMCKQAEEFVLNYMTPILGPLHTIKVHKLLRHVLDSITMHGNLQNGNTSTNESEHKVDKKFYRRTNKSIATFTAQIVRQSQGTREVLKRLDADDAELLRSTPPAVGASAALAAAAGGAAGAPRAVSARHSPMGAPQLPLLMRTRLRMTVASLSRRPGLQSIGRVLNRPAKYKLGVTQSKKFVAELDCGAPLVQIVRASSSFRGTPWYDAVLYTLDSASRTSTENDANQHDASVQFIGEVRAIIRGKDEDLAVICNMAPAPSASPCPLSARECSVLKWAVPADGGDWSITVVPFRFIVRVVHVVPDFADLLKRRGVLALPPAVGGPLADLRAMRYFVNAFYPWG